MSWTTPRTWVTSELVTSTIGNTHWRDNLNYLYNRVYEASGSTVDVASTAAETTIYSKVIAGGAMAATSVLRCVITGDYLHNNGAGDTIILKVKFGGTDFWVMAANNLNNQASATRQAWTLKLWLSNQGATNSQNLTGEWLSQAANSSAPTTGIGSSLGTGQSAIFGSNGLLAIDTTSNQTLDITATWSSSHANNSWRKRFALLELLP